LIEFNRLSEEAFQEVLKKIQAVRAASVSYTEVPSA
jgi:hypothetical protein